jgi:hypothetical protein
VAAESAADPLAEPAIRQRWGSDLPVPLPGLTLLNPDYRATSLEDWRSLGVAVPAPLPDRFDAVAAWARHADTPARARD